MLGQVPGLLVSGCYLHESKRIFSLSQKTDISSLKNVSLVLHALRWFVWWEAAVIHQGKAAACRTQHHVVITFPQFLITCFLKKVVKIDARCQFKVMYGQVFCLIPLCCSVTEFQSWPFAFPILKFPLRSCSSSIVVAHTWARLISFRVLVEEPCFPTLLCGNGCK